jgi:hypothetical protein
MCKIIPVSSDLYDECNIPTVKYPYVDVYVDECNSCWYMYYTNFSYTYMFAGSK